jgi:hypothetical protein
MASIAEKLWSQQNATTTTTTTAATTATASTTVATASSSNGTSIGPRDDDDANSNDDGGSDSVPETVLPRLLAFRCLLNERGVAAAPVTNLQARNAPSGPGSCLDQRRRLAL